MGKKYIIDDRLIIPDYIMKMSDRELDEFIAKMIKEDKEKKERLNNKRTAVM